MADDILIKKSKLNAFSIENDVCLQLTKKHPMAINLITFIQDISIRAKDNGKESKQNIEISQKDVIAPQEDVIALHKDTKQKDTDEPQSNTPEQKPILPQEPVQNNEPVIISIKRQNHPKVDIELNTQSIEEQFSVETAMERLEQLNQQQKNYIKNQIESLQEQLEIFKKGIV